MHDTLVFYWSCWSQLESESVDELENFFLFNIGGGSLFMPSSESYSNLLSSESVPELEWVLSAKFYYHWHLPSWFCSQLNPVYSLLELDPCYDQKSSFAFMPCQISIHSIFLGTSLLMGYGVKWFLVIPFAKPDPKGTRNLHQNTWDTDRQTRKITQYPLTIGRCGTCSL